MLDVPTRSEGGADALALTFPDAIAKQASAAGVVPSFQGFGLAARVLAGTIGFVFLAMSLFYVTRLTAHREMWLHAKIGAAQTTVEAFGLAGPTPPPQDLAQKILHSVDVKWLAVETPSGRREFVVGRRAQSQSPPTTVPISRPWRPPFAPCSLNPTGS